MAKKVKFDTTYYVSLVERITTLHGMSQFTSKRGRLLWLWTILMILNIILMISFIFVIKDKFNENKIVTQINANCKVNQVPFPAVSICNFNQVSLKESQNIARVLRHYNISESNITNFFNGLPNLAYFDQNIRKLPNFTDIMSILKHHYYTIDTIMEEVHQKCSNLALYCTFNRKLRNCADIFFLVKTCFGYCCAFNYAALKDASELPFVDPDPDLEYYDDKTNDEDNSDGEEIPPYAKIIATSESGRVYLTEIAVFHLTRAGYNRQETLSGVTQSLALGRLLKHMGYDWVHLGVFLGGVVMTCYFDKTLVTAGGKTLCVAITRATAWVAQTVTRIQRASGLSVVFNVDPNDYPSWSPIPFYGAKIIINDPNDYPEISNIYRYVTLGESVDIKVEPRVFQSQSDVRRVDPRKRECWFHDEVYLGHTDRYSYETCWTECKMKAYYQGCNCMPYKYPRDPNMRTCEFEDLRCLNNVTAYVSTRDMSCTPICYVECRDKNYKMTSDVNPFLSSLYPDEVTKDVNVSGLAALQVYFGKSNCNCYKLSLVIDLNYFVATYGGVFSLSFGGSIITFVELTYLIVSFVVSVTLRALSKLFYN